MAQHDLWRGSLVQKARLVSGLILFAFATAHFFNHALGLVSLDAMLTFDDWRIAIDRSIIGSIVLLAALLIHVALATWKMVRRRTLRLPIAEWAQIVLGFAIPIFLLPHIVNTRVAATAFGVSDTYSYELARIWPASFVPQSVLLLLVWIHGCLGLHFWLRSTPLYRRLAPLLLAIAVLLPFAALAGSSVQGRIIEAAIRDPAQLQALKAETHWPDERASASIQSVREDAQNGYVVGLFAIAAAVALGLAVSQRAKRIQVQYVGGPLVRTELGPTLLEISRRNKIPHLSTCGGRGRCSTCRVLVLSGGAEAAPPSDAERKTLKTIGAADNVRLACQLRPSAAITIMPLLKSATTEQRLPAMAEADTAAERELAVLFVDMRGFTALTESRLPFDVIYILNQFFGTVGGPIHANDGWITNYAGDGLIALFGDPAGLAATCRSAMVAAAEIDRALSALNERLVNEMRQPLRIAMGLHAGPHVLGRVGYGEKPAISVVGLAMNVASRLEAMAKTAGVQMAVSQIVADHGRLDTRDLRAEATAVRGLSAPIDVVFVEAARDLLPRLQSDVLAS
ncbi:adenylate/guanylate cyclase domain-containing protein [Lichenihabitans psoromatis]|uniref:adenylate/guanylate cyclase domain-containing protein n=1 Tax=Lichenihabitans psoromatis TaxID=2528642 RepID=UPI001FE05C8F|nr:adenylate/guanylate cyclase domain-containing protein [Lichenihabitans psoromatis]